MISKKSLAFIKNSFEKASKMLLSDAIIEVRLAAIKLSEALSEQCLFAIFQSIQAVYLEDVYLSYSNSRGPPSI